jgi:hypothetical protein
MRESTIESLMAKYCYGDPEQSKDSEILTYVDQFLHGLNKLSGLYETGASRELDQQDVLTMLPALHCQNGLNIYVGEGSIDKELLCRKSLLNTSQQISGRTLLRLAKEVLCNCKKMMALVTGTASPYKNGTFPSGMTWDDYARWCLSAFHHSECGVSKSYVHFGEESKDEQRADEVTVDAETTKMSSSTSALDENSDATAMQQDYIQQSQLPVLPSNNTDPLSPLPSVPTGYFFKGYLAWCLWGHIPVAPQSASTSTLFTDAKVDASFRRSAGSRAALKRSADSATTKNAKKKMQVDGGAPITSEEATSICASTITTTTPSSNRQRGSESNIGGMMGILTKTLAFISEESLESERQKNALLKIRRIREKIHAANRKHDQLSNVIYRSGEQGNSNIRDQQLQRLLVHETEISELETKLDELLDAETDRRQKVLSDRTTAHHLERKQQGEQEARRVTQDDSPHSWCSSLSSRDNNNLGVITTTPLNAAASIGHETSLLCNECGVMPTQRKCRKCKERYVCDVCCSTKRGLELAWWCATCFGKESAASQTLIRSGDYDSEADHD